MHPLLLVYVIILVPGVTPDIKPVLLTVATPGFADTHGVDAAGVPDPVSCVFDPAHTVSVPVMVGNELTVIVAVLMHPLSIVYVITLVPAVTPVTRPELSMVATPGDAEIQGLVGAGVPEPVNCVVDPVQTLSVPVIVGDALTVTVTEMLHPLLFV